MVKLIFIITILAVSVVIGRTIRDMIRKRPIRDKQTRRKPLHLFFAVTAVFVILFVALTIGIGGNIQNLLNYQSLELLILFLAVLIFGIYVMIEVIKYIDKLRKK